MMKKWMTRAGLALLATSFLVLSIGFVGIAAAGSEAAIAIDPPSGKKATAITITGTGFQPQEEVDVTITLGPGQRVGLGTEKVEIIVADDQGGFSVPSAIPMNAKPGTYPIDVEGSKGSAFITNIVVTE